ncbi:hypothetical protein TNCV_2141771 [Trichonephila clavipes]|uniref:Uncharacterized protein n=1 Tax=Trichonephila clavipes TaxID=2585209 RepID=A0A8X6VC67_TRICX|nr:hypothetical protein TNCV_2141771 [Trichonephila clavipes]
MRAKAYCAQFSIRDLGPEVHEQKFQSGGQSDEKPPVLSSQAGLNQCQNLMKEVVDLARQINLEVDSDDVLEMLDSHNQELTFDELIGMQEQDIEEPSSIRRLNDNWEFDRRPQFN